MNGLSEKQLKVSASQISDSTFIRKAEGLWVGRVEGRTFRSPENFFPLGFLTQKH